MMLVLIILERRTPPFAFAWPACTQPQANAVRMMVRVTHPAPPAAHIMTAKLDPSTTPKQI
jgi:hypothetical protein